MRKIQLTQGKMAMVDDEDFKYLNQWKWHLHGDGYACRTMKKIKMHRVLIDCPINLEVDHIDGNKLNNQKSNLRICTHQQNMANQKKYKTNTTGYKGVTIWKQYIRAQIQINKKRIYLGFFPDLISAAKAYDKKAKELWGSFARLNFPENKQ
jgi:hypothetical protein